MIGYVVIMTRVARVATSEYNQAAKCSGGGGGGVVDFDRFF